MDHRSEAQSQISRAIDGAEDELIRLSQTIHSHPEIGFEEREAARLLTDALQRHGCRVDQGVAEMETAFLGWMEGQAAQPCIGLVCEYDALPKLGHACGHNLTLGGVFHKNMEQLGMALVSVDPHGGTSSTDFGNLSQQMPAASAKFTISGDRPLAGHSDLFRQAAGTDEGQRAMLTIAKAYAMTAFDVLTQPDTLSAAQHEFGAARQPLHVAGHS